ncbi:hypothetical protein [Sunxiuqinia sp. sy24]
MFIYPEDTQKQRRRYPEYSDLNLGRIDEVWLGVVIYLFCRSDDAG